jgi:hypothetical protein
MGKKQDIALFVGGTLACVGTAFIARYYVEAGPASASIAASCSAARETVGKAIERGRDYNGPADVLAVPSLETDMQSCYEGNVPYVGTSAVKNLQAVHRERATPDSAVLLAAYSGLTGRERSAMDRKTSGDLLSVSMGIVSAACAAYAAYGLYDIFKEPPKPKEITG